MARLRSMRGSEGPGGVATYHWEGVEGFGARSAEGEHRHRIPSSRPPTFDCAQGMYFPRIQTETLPEAGSPRLRGKPGLYSMVKAPDSAGTVHQNQADPAPGQWDAEDRSI